MKRIGYLHEQIYSLDNIYLADSKARLNKRNRWGINKHDKHRDKENIELEKHTLRWLLQVQSLEMQVTLPKQYQERDLIAHLPSLLAWGFLYL